MPILRRKCPVDGKVFELLSIRGVLSALDHPDLEHLGCPDCGAEGEAILSGFLPKDLGGDAGAGRWYPYYDRGLGGGPDGRGILVRSAQHRKWLLKHHPSGAKRDIPLLPTDGDFDPEEELNERTRLQEASEKAYREQMDELEHGPNREAWGKLQDVLKDKATVERLWGNNAG